VSGRGQQALLNLAGLSPAQSHSLVHSNSTRRLPVLSGLLAAQTSTIFLASEWTSCTPLRGVVIAVQQSADGGLDYLHSFGAAGPAEVRVRETDPRSSAGQGRPGNSGVVFSAPVALHGSDAKTRSQLTAEWNAEDCEISGRGTALLDGCANCGR